MKRFFATIGKRRMVRIPDPVLKKLNANSGDVLVFEVNQEVKIKKLT